eukprot:g25746.t1
MPHVRFDFTSPSQRPLFLAGPCFALSPFGFGIFWAAALYLYLRARRCAKQGHFDAGTKWHVIFHCVGNLANCLFYPGLLRVERPERARRFMELGALQTGLEKTRFLERRLPRLPPARTHFWEAKSSLQAVRDLYDCYAADPLMACRPTSAAIRESRSAHLTVRFVCLPFPEKRPAMTHSEAWERLSGSKSGCDMLMERLHRTTQTFSPSSTDGESQRSTRGARPRAGQMIVGPRAQLEPPYTRCMVDHGKVVDSGRFAPGTPGPRGGRVPRFAFLERLHLPTASASPSASAVRVGSATARGGATARFQRRRRGHEELATLRRSNLEKFLPKNQPHENTFARIWGRSDPPLYTGEVAQQSPMVCTCAGVMRRPKSQDRDEDFMSEYLEKQAVIEHLLHKRQGRLEELMEHATCPAEPSTPPAPTVSVKEQAPKEVRILCPSFQVLAHTKNLQFDGDVLRNKRWSGGVVFARANAEDPSFEIVVQPQDGGAERAPSRLRRTSAAERGLRDETTRISSVAVGASSCAWADQPLMDAWALWEHLEEWYLLV